MPMIKRFEDLQSWQKARQLANMVYDLTDRSRFAQDFQCAIKFVVQPDR